MILITRPENDGTLLAKKLELLKIKYIISPVIKISYISNLEQTIKKHYQKTKNIIITSKNALRAVENILEKNAMLHIIGEETSNIAKDLGYKNIVIVEKNVDLLIKSLKFSYLLNTKFLYIRGNIVTNDLKKEFYGIFKIIDIICYISEKNPDFDHKIIDILEKKPIEIIVFFSYKTAQYFIESVKNNYIKHKLSSITAVTISNKTNSCLNEIKWKNIIISPEPTEKAIIKIIKEIKA